MIEEGTIQPNLLDFISHTRCNLCVTKALICEDQKQDNVCQLGIGAETKVSVKVRKI